MNFSSRGDHLLSSMFSKISAVNRRRFLLSGTAAGGPKASSESTRRSRAIRRATLNRFRKLPIRIETICARRYK